VQQRLEGTWRSKLCGHPLKADTSLDTILLQLLQDNASDPSLLSDNKAELDSAFRLLCQTRSLQQLHLAAPSVASGSAQPAAASSTEPAAPE
jgi:hypothetical protein